MFNGQKGSYISLLDKCGYTTLFIRCIKTIATEVFKSLNNLNSTFEAKPISYDLRNSNVLFQPKWQKVTCGKHTFKNYGSLIWNLLPNEIKSCTELDKFKSLLKSWEGPKCQYTMCNALKAKLYGL